MFKILMFFIFLLINFAIFMAIIMRKDTHLSYLRLFIKAIGLEFEIKIKNKEKSAPSIHDKH
jgi:hypothetical protein